MTLQQLRYFLATAEHGSFSAAAGELHLAQPSVSEQVRLLESELGVALFVRAGRSLALTEAGRTLRGHAGRVLASVDDARSAVAEVRQVLTGTVTLGIFGTASYYFVAEVIEAFRRRHPGVRVRLVGENSAQVVEDIRAGRIEAGVVVLPVDDEGLDVRPIGRDEVLYASARLRRVKQPATIEHVASVPLVLAFATHGRARPDAAAAGRAGAGTGLSIEAAAIEVEDPRRLSTSPARGLADTVISSAIASSPSFPKGLGVVSFADPFHETFAIVTRRQTVLSPAGHRAAASRRAAPRRTAIRGLSRRFARIAPWSSIATISPRPPRRSAGPARCPPGSTRIRGCSISSASTSCCNAGSSRAARRWCRTPATTARSRRSAAPSS